MRYFLVIQCVWMVLCVTEIEGKQNDKYTKIPRIASYLGRTHRIYNGDGLNMQRKGFHDGEGIKKAINLDLLENQIKRRHNKQDDEKIDMNWKHLPLVQECLEAYKNKTHDMNNYTIVSIDHVSTQHVGGILTEIVFHITKKEQEQISRCIAQVWSYFADNFTEYNVHCRTNFTGYDPMLKMWLFKDPTDAKYLEMAKVSMKIFLNKSNIDTEQQITKVRRVRVSRPNSVVEIIFNIYAPAKNQTRTCTSTIYDENYKKVVVTCVFGDLPLENHEEQQLAIKYKALAYYAFQNYDKTKDNTTDCKVTAVDRALEQSVDGKIIEIDFKIAQPGIMMTNMDCHAEMWLISEFDNDIIVTCDHTKRFTKVKSDDYQEQIDKMYKSLALIALQKFFKEKAPSNPYNVQVERAKERNLDGVMTKIQFKIYCDSYPTLVPCKSQLWEDRSSYRKNITYNECYFRSNLENNHDTPLNKKLDYYFYQLFL